MVQTVSSVPEFYNAINSDKLSVIDAYAEWCGPCKMIAPYLQTYSQKYDSANFIKIDVDELSELAQELGIRAMPTFLFFKSGSKIDELVGADPRKLENLIQKNL